MKYIIILFSILSIFIASCETKIINPPYAMSTKLKGLEYDWKTYIQLAPGSDNWPVTWAKDDNQYTSWGDGGGFGGTNLKGRVSLGVARIYGERDNFKGENIFGGFSPLKPANISGKSYGILAIEDVLYLWVSPGSNEEAYEESRLYSSGDYGESWVAAKWAFDKDYSIVNPTFLQFGRGYQKSRDDFVYIYTSRVKNYKTLEVQKPGEILLIRVSKDALMDRNSYQFFSGKNTSGEINWTDKIEESKPVFLDNNGVGWNTSVVYHTGLKKYILVTEHDKTMQGNMGVFEADEPWGPWATVYYGQFILNGKTNANTFFYNFSNKWSDDNGTGFTMIFTGIGQYDTWNSVAGEFTIQNKLGDNFK